MSVLRLNVCILCAKYYELRYYVYILHLVKVGVFDSVKIRLYIILYVKKIMS